MYVGATCDEWKAEHGPLLESKGRWPSGTTAASPASGAVRLRCRIAIRQTAEGADKAEQQQCPVAHPQRRGRQRVNDHGRLPGLTGPVRALDADPDGPRHGPLRGRLEP